MVCAIIFIIIIVTPIIIGNSGDIMVTLQMDLRSQIMDQRFKVIFS